MLAGRGQKKQKIYLRIVSGFMLVTVIVILATAGLLMAASQNVVSSLTYRNSQADLAQSSTRIQSAIEKANNLTNMIFQDLDISYMLYDTSFNASRLRKAVRRLCAYRDMEPTIRSIYIYNGSTKMVSVSARRHGSVENQIFGENAAFVDGDLAEILLHLSEYNRSLPIPRYIDEIDNAHVNRYQGYTFFFSQSLLGGEDHSNVFVNFDESLFELEDSEGKVALLDENGKVIVSSHYPLGYDLSGEEVWKRITGLSEDSGSFRKSVEGEEMLVTCLKLPFEQEWRLVRLVPYALVAKEASLLRRLALLATGMVVLAGGLAVMITSRTVYAPIQVMHDRLDQVSVENSQLRRIERQHLLRRMLFGEKVSAERLQRLGFSQEDAEMRLMILHVCGSQLVQDRLEAQYATAISEICLRLEELLNRKMVARTVELPDGYELAAAVSAPKGFPSLEECEAALRVVLEEAKARYGMTLQPIVGEQFPDFSQMGAQFSLLQDGLFRLRYLGKAELWHAADVPDTADDLFDYQLSRESQLSGLLLGENWKQAEQMTHKIIEEACGLSYYVLDMTVTRLTYLYISILKLVHKRCDSQEILTFPKPLDLNRADGLEEVNGYFDGLICRIEEIAAKKKNNRPQELAQRVNEILEQNLQDSSLNLDAIAEQVGMSAAYVGRIYKASAGMSISEKLCQLRMERAQELLRTQKQLTVKQIAEMTGFTSNTYFSRAFKRETGVTPNEYRLKMTAES